jgi:hypothetical protein
MRATHKSCKYFGCIASEELGAFSLESDGAEKRRSMLARRQ